MANSANIVSRVGTAAVVNSQITASGGVSSSVIPGSSASSSITPNTNYQTQVSGAAGPQGIPGNDGVFSEIASKAEAEAGTDNVKGMSPLRTKQSITENESVSSVNSQTGAVVLDQDDVGDGTTYKRYSATEKTKLAGIATGATANDTDANLKNRANHTGVQAISTVTDLQTTLDGKVDENTPITGATKTKITYDADGLVTSGADATTADIADSTDKRYVTDAEATVIDNTSGSNTGDQDISNLVTGPASATDNAVPKYHLTTGKIIQNTGVIINDFDDLYSPNVLEAGLAVGAPTLVGDDIIELTENEGVTIDGVLIKDGEVDGRDVATDGSKLDGIETAADVTDATNVASAGAVMDSELITTSAGAGDEGKPVKLDAGGHIDATMINDADVSLDNVTEGSTNKFFTSTLKTKLDGIEAAADVTDTANVTSAGALMDSEVDADIKTLALPANTTISTFGASIIDDADEATFKATVNLEIGTDVQAYDAYLADIAALTSTQGDILYFNGTDWVALGVGSNGQFLKTQGAAANPTWDTIAGGGDMLASTYDPTAVSDDAFDMDNMAEGTTTKIMTADERTKLTGIETGADVTDTTNVTAAGALMDSEVDADIKTLSLPASTTITAAAATVLDDASVSAMVDTLGGASATGTGGLVRATSPALTTPTGIVKGDVGLGNVDNTSDATKNAAAVTLTNKTIDGDDNTISDIASESLKSTVAAAGYLSSDQSINTSTITTIIYDTEYVDAGADYNATTGVFTCPVAGTYFVSGGAQMLGQAAANEQYLYIYKNTAAVYRAHNQTSTSDYEIQLNVSGLVVAAANDTIDVRIWHNRGAARSVEGSIATHFSIHLVGA